MVKIAEGKVTIDVILEDGSVAKGVADLDGKLQGLGGSGEKASLGIGKIVTALGITALASKGIDMVKNSLDGAINRYDTLNQFPRVMERIGFDAESSQGAIDKLSDGIQGLPTALDDVAGKAQNIAIMTGDLDGAVDTTLALNNAFLASGSSTADAERGLAQYVQMLGKGEVDLQSWRTLQETMGLGLNEVAESFGFAGASAQNDLFKALQDGEVTFDQFNDKMIEMSEKTGGFADIAKESSGGIKTSFANVGTALVSGMAGVIGAIDEALGGVGSMEGIIERVKVGIQEAFKVIVEWIPKIVEGFKQVFDILEPWLPLIASIASGITAAIVAFEAFQKVKAIIDTVKDSVGVLSGVLAANPWVLIIGAVIAVVALIYFYWEPISGFFIELWDAIKESGLAIWDVLKDAWTSTAEFFINLWTGLVDGATGIWEGLAEDWATVVEQVKEAWSTVKEFFVDLWTGLVEGATGIWDGLVEDWNTVVEQVTEAWASVKEFFAELFIGLALGAIGIWQSLVEDWNLVVEQITELWTGISTFFAELWASIVEVAMEAWGAFSEAIMGILTPIIEAVMEVFDNMGEGIALIFEGIVQFFTEIWEVIKNIFVGALLILLDLFTLNFSALQEDAVMIMDNIKEAFTLAWEAIKMVFEGFITAIVEFVTTSWEKMAEFTRFIFEQTGIMIETTWQNIKNVFQIVIDAIVSFVTTSWNSLLTFTTNLFNTMMSAISSAWTAIQTAVTTAVDAVVNFVVTGWETLKNKTSEVFNAVLTFISSTFTQALNFVISAVTSIINFVVEGWNNILSTVSSVGSTIAQAVSTMWESIKTFFTTTLAELVTTTTTKFGEVKEAIRTKMSEALDAVIEFVGKMPGKVIEKAGEMLSAGKELVMGLINGIVGMAQDAIDAITGVVGGVIEKARSLLQSKSPSRVFRGLGNDTVRGYEIGIEERKNRAEREIKRLFDGVLSETKRANAKELTEIKNNNTEIKKLERRAGEDINLIKQKALKTKRDLTQAESIRIQRIEEDTINKVRKIQEKNMKIQTDIAKKQNKELIDVSDKYVKRQRENGNMSLQDEIYYWNAMYRSAQKGSAKYNSAMEKHQGAVAQLRSEIEAKNKQFNDIIIKVEEDFNAETKRLYEEYGEVYNSRLNQLMGFAGIFEAFVRKTEISGQDLIENLQGQVNALHDYGKVINELSIRIDDKELMEELRGMGVESLGELEALNDLTNKELSEYAKLYKEKFKLANDHTKDEMKPMKKELESKLKQLQDTADSDLRKLAYIWGKHIEDIVKGTTNEFDSLRQVGKDAIKGLEEGMGSMRGSLMAQAKKLAEDVKKTISKAFDIKSPSRWAENVIGKNIVLGWIAGVDGEKNAAINKAKQMSEWFKPEIAEAFINPLRGAGAQMPGLASASAGMSAGGFTGNNGGGNNGISKLVDAIVKLTDRDVVVQIDGEEIVRATSGGINRTIGSASALNGFMKGGRF